MNISLKDHVLQMLLLGKKIIRTTPLLISEVGTVNVKGDKTIGMDLKIEQAMIDYIRNTGSNIGNLSYVLENIAAGLGGVCMRPEEIGAVVSLIKGAGGIAVNHQGKDLGEEEFSSDKTYEILAGAQDVIKFTLEQIKV